MPPRTPHADDTTTPHRFSATGGSPNDSSFLEQIYPGAGQWWLREHTALRYFHADLANKSRGELRMEIRRLRLRLTLDDVPERWLLQRHHAVVEALHERV